MNKDNLSELEEEDEEDFQFEGGSDDFDDSSAHRIKPQ